MQEARKTSRRLSDYAGPTDFCRIFSEDMSHLYMLAFLLTADQQMAEQCFHSALQACRKANRVFRDWARAWSRRAIIQSAIRLVRSAPEVTSELAQPFSTVAVGIPARAIERRLREVTALPPFERFVFVMSFLESYSDHECRILLGCLPYEIAEARRRALEHIGRSVDATAAAELVHDAAADLYSGSVIPPNKSSSIVDSGRLNSTH